MMDKSKIKEAMLSKKWLPSQLSIYVTIFIVIAVSGFFLLIVAIHYYPRYKSVKYLNNGILLEQQSKLNEAKVFYAASLKEEYNEEAMSGIYRIYTQPVTARLIHLIGNYPVSKKEFFMPGKVGPSHYEEPPGLLSRLLLPIGAGEIYRDIISRLFGGLTHRRSQEIENYSRKVSGITYLDYVNGLVFNADGTLSFLNNGNVEVWDAKRGLPLKTFPHSGGPLEINPNSNYHVTLKCPERLYYHCGSGVIEIWDIKRHVLVRTIRTKLMETQDIAVSPRGDFIALDGCQIYEKYKCKDPKIQLLDFNSGDVTKTIEHTDANAYYMHFSPDGSLLLFQDRKGLNVYDAQTGSLLKLHRGYSGPYTFMPDKKTLVIMKDYRIEFRDVLNGDISGTIDISYKHANLHHITINPEGDILAAAFGFGSYPGDVSWEHIRIWRIEKNNIPRIIETGTDRLIYFQFGPDGETMLTMHQNDTFHRSLPRIYVGAADDDLEKTLRSKGFLPFPNYYDSIIYSPNERLIATFNIGQSIKIWDATSYKFVKELNVHAGSFLFFSQDGNVLMSASEGGAIKLIDIASGQVTRSVNIGRQIINMAPSPDWSTLTLFGKENRWNIRFGFGLNYNYVISRRIEYVPMIWLWDFRNNRLLKSFQLLSSGQYSLNVMISPDGKKVATSGEADQIKIWNATNGNLLHTFEGHLGIYDTQVFDSGSKFIASATADNTLKLWNCETGLPIMTINNVSSSRYLKFDRVNSHIAASYSDGTIRIWPLPPEITNEDPKSLLRKAEFESELKLKDNGLYLWKSASGEIGDVQVSSKIKPPSHLDMIGNEINQGEEEGSLFGALDIFTTFSFVVIILFSMMQYILILVGRKRIQTFKPSRGFNWWATRPIWMVGIYGSFWLIAISFYYVLPFRYWYYFRSPLVLVRLLVFVIIIFFPFLTAVRRITLYKDRLILWRWLGHSYIPFKRLASIESYGKHPKMGICSFLKYRDLTYCEGPNIFIHPKFGRTIIFKDRDIAFSAKLSETFNDYRLKKNS